MQTPEPTRNYPAGANRSPIAGEHRITYWLHEEIERQCDGFALVLWEGGASARLVGR